MPSVALVQHGEGGANRGLAGIFTALYPFCRKLRIQVRRPASGFAALRGMPGVGMSGSVRSTSMRSWLPTLRFRAKIILGFALVLAISAVSLGLAYLGFERVSAAVASYRNSVSEADLARNIDRELISYRSAVKYYVATGKEDDAKAALAAEASLKDAIDKAIKRHQEAGAARADHASSASEFRNFAATFAEILKVKRDSALIAQNQLSRNANMLRYKLDDLAQQRRRFRGAGDRVRRQAGHRASSRPRARSPTLSSSTPTRRSPPARWRG